MSGSKLTRLTEIVVKNPNSIPTGTCKKCLGLNALLNNINSVITSIVWNITVATPISIPQITLSVYGIELTGVEPKLDLIERPTPNVIKNKPKKYKNEK